MKPFFNNLLVIPFTFSLLLVSCGTSQKVAATSSTTPTPPPSTKVTSTIGTRIEEDPCEELAYDITAENPREFGNGMSRSESLATNLAMLDARSKLAQRIDSYVQGLIVSANGQYNSSTGSTGSNGASQFSESYSNTNQSGQTQTSKWEKHVANSKVIKRSRYLRDDGQFNIYVCVEMPKEQLSSIYKELSEGHNISSEISEQMFLEGFKMTLER